MKNIFFVLCIFIVSLMIASVSAATYHGKFSVSTGGISVQACEEDWSNSFWSECDNNNEQTFVCIQTNPLCDGENLKPEQCGETRSCEEVIPPSNEDGGGSGGGSSGGGGGGGIVTISDNQEEEACAEQWSCSEWSNSEESCGTRTCTDSNTCGTTELKPETYRKCESFSSDNVTFFFSGVGNFVKSNPVASIIFLLIVAGIIYIGVGVKKSPPVPKSE